MEHRELYHQLYVVSQLPTHIKLTVPALRYLCHNIPRVLPLLEVLQGHADCQAQRDGRALRFFIFP